SVINTATNATTHVVSSESGTYSAANLPPGTYRMEASLTGFRSAKVDGIRLTAGATARVDITLNLGAIEESVTVMARSPLVSIEAGTEFSVATNGFKSEFGQAGGGAITFASKSGTNTFQGSLYNFLRNDAFDSKGFFEAKKGIYRQNNFGASWGGPVQVPYVY